MKRYLIITFIFSPLFFSCRQRDKKSLPVVLKKESTPYDSSNTKNTPEEILKRIPKNIKPVFGYRFIITGDFDGDGKKEPLVEHFF